MAGTGADASPRPQVTLAWCRERRDDLTPAQRPVLVTGSGILWSQASAELEQFVNETGIPFYTTP